MKYLVFFLLNGCLMTTSNAQLDLDQYRWKNRVIVLLTENFESDKTTYFQQRDTLNTAPEALEDRDLVLLAVTKDFASAQELKLWNRFNPDDAPFRFILIGKDGGVKMDETEFVPPRRIFQTIDAMPMRRREMRERN